MVRSMKVFVAGGTGAVGSTAVSALIAAGHQVTALARSPEKAAELTASGAAPIAVSLFDRVALQRAISGHEAVVNLATAIPPMNRFVLARAWRENDRIRTAGSAILVDAALGAGVSRVVQESVCMLYHDQGDSWVDEDASVDPFPIARANLAAESSANRFTQEGGTGVVLRFGWFYGPGAAHSEQLLAAAKRHVGLLIGRPASYLSSIHVADAGAAAAAALKAPAGSFNVVDDEPLTTEAYADALAAAAAARMWVRIPGRAGTLFGDRLTSLTRSLRVSNKRFRAATGWSPQYPSAREGWIATAAAL